MSWFPIKKEDFNRDRPKEVKKNTKIVLKKIKLPTQLKSDTVRWTMFCPRLCQQKSNGSKGKKTYDGEVCHACGYKKIPSFH